jgi:UPF0755 protein
MFAIFRWLLITVSVALGAAVGMLFYDMHEPLQDEATIVILPGTGVRAVSEQLHAAGLVRWPLTVLCATMIYGDLRRLQAGEYILPPGVNLLDVLDKMRRGDVVKHFFTIPEGQRVSEIVAQLRADQRLTGVITIMPQEGELLPETYQIRRGDNRQHLVERMQAAMTDALARAWAVKTEACHLQSPQELLILASIVEKETAKAVERPRVAGVYLNRLRRGMLLQACPTVIYGLMVADQWQGGSPLLRSHLKIPTPYNTYMNRGLTPTPIACPGLASLMAVAQPLVTDELYFAADGAGGHQFASTFKQHQQHHQHLRQWRRQAM